jgi:hypothetical protein
MSFGIETLVPSLVPMYFYFRVIKVLATWHALVYRCFNLFYKINWNKNLDNLLQILIALTIRENMQQIM